MSTTDSDTTPDNTAHGGCSGVTCSACNGRGYYETWKHDYGSAVRKHKCPCRIPHYVQPGCPLLGIKGGDPMTLWGIATDLEDEDNLTQNAEVRHGAKDADID